VINQFSKNGYNIKTYTDPAHFQAQDDIQEYFDYIKTSFFMKTSGPDLKNLTYKPKLDISTSLSKIWTIMNRYPKIIKK